MNYKGIVDNITALASGNLNNWECGFIESMQRKIANNINLSETEQNKIRDIQNKYLKH